MKYLEKPLKKVTDEEAALSITTMRNKAFAENTYRSKHPAAEDFYTTYDEYKVTKEDKEEYDKFIKSLPDEEKELLGANLNFYQIDFKNLGGLVMPVILKFKFVDGTEEVQYIPAEIWRKNNEEVSKVFMFGKEVEQITLDPYRETADTDLNNNFWPTRKQPTRFELYKSRYGGGRYGGAQNPMQKAKKK